MLIEGAAAPDWSAPDQNGQTISSSDLRGKWIAMWWYPKASTPG
ncbi:MAG: redoxin domain-containing protein [Actinomycetia bacterium]|nr:redoxin domain-containing protein [Actinomycetes bacterium]MCP4962225.1 redoxin domain-containing protein [Actinomycetes bacterium]